MGSLFYQGSGIKIWGKMGLRDQNNGKKIGINGSRIYHVTTLFRGVNDHQCGATSWAVHETGILPFFVLRQ